MLKFLAVLMLVAGAAAAPSLSKTMFSQAIAGKASVIDGDTIAIGRTRIRLHGIDAPEMDQECQAKRGKTYKCGVVARKVLSDLLKGRIVKCKGNERDAYGRLIAKCFVKQLDVGEQMVLIGRALAYRKYSTDYVRSENAAKSMREGMWRGKFIPPWEWRREHRADAANTLRQEPNQKCLIKGNISRNGRIYHVPGGQYYGRTKITQGKGERWFCTEAEARAAGWRRSKR